MRLGLMSRLALLPDVGLGGVRISIGHTVQSTVSSTETPCPRSAFAVHVSMKCPSPACDYVSSRQVNISFSSSRRIILETSEGQRSVGGQECPRIARG